MIVCFQADAHLKQRLDAMLEYGYSGYDNLIASAIHNLEAIHREMNASVGGAVVLDAGTVSRLSATASAVAPHASAQKIEPAGVPARFQAADAAPAVTAPEPDGTAPDGTVFIETWIWGQYNKLLAAKAAARAFAHYPDGFALRDEAWGIAEAATLLGDELKAYDARHGLKKDSSFALAFPTSEQLEQKGAQRFANQFVGHFDKKGSVHGMLFDLGLAGMLDAPSPYVALTPTGAAWALLPNPALDALEGDDVKQKFTASERELLLQHIAARVPRERGAFRIVLEAIDYGENTPQALDAWLVRFCGREDITPAFISTQRAGVLSRMVDLELMRRVRDGVRFTYELTESGHDFLEVTA